ncbi:DASS family sodium-coupled anion symporter [Ruficoccus amylovorans]|uniref:DASS family sodium-coupled anion symporter n=1 Tax=Ruficoccus amylovorans TaxID=1804625 RepID=A0A842HIP2_9BACT|nr:DASS family sodium-coupled anion symporter [Ruficoccus amylovorans]MBC2595387.1 DASS family sodium-coupled anion symporter [Ruficoccus amylovorans]
MSNKHPESEELAGVLEASPAEQHYRVQKDSRRDPDDHSRDFGMRQRVGLIFGPAAFLLILFMPTPEGMSVEAQRVAAVTFLMATWWISEAIPIPATSLLPIVLFPALGVMPTAEATEPYASHLIFLYMGGFIIALAMQRWDLHRRIALHVIRTVGFSPGRLVLGFMVATALLSAFVSNTATTVMMLPIGMAVITQVTEELLRNGREDARAAMSPLALNLMLGIAYAASIGGIATLIGTPPNTVLASYLSKTYGYEITFTQWLKVGVPLTVLFLPLAWLWLTRVSNRMPRLELPNAGNIITEELKKMGAMSKAERWTSVVFVCTALGWIFRPQLAHLFPDPAMLTDASVAMAGALLLFVLPVNYRKRLFVMDWEWAAKLPWGVLILFGGGLSMANAFGSSGLAAWIVGHVNMLGNLPLFAIVVGVTVLVIFLTEFTSNTATSTMLMPLLGGIALGIGENPLLLLAPAAIAASCAFMLPVATPPNAIVFGSGYVRIPDMVRCGFGLNLIAIVLIPIILYFVLVPLFGIVLGEVPAWAQ